jgi:hypothetical protein
VLLSKLTTTLNLPCISPHNPYFQNLKLRWIKTLWSHSLNINWLPYDIATPHTLWNPKIFTSKESQYYLKTWGIKDQQVSIPTPNKWIAADPKPRTPTKALTPLDPKSHVTWYNPLSFASFSPLAYDKNYYVIRCFCSAAKFWTIDLLHIDAFQIHITSCT